MAGQASGGQQLTPNPNVSAPAGFGGDKWGANGGGIAAIGTAKPVQATLADGETAANYEQSPIPLNNKGASTQSVQSLTSNGALSAQTLDTSLAAGGSNQG